MQNSVDLNVNDPDWMESHVINADLDISCPFVVTVILKVASSGWMKMGRASVKRVAGWMKMGRASVKRVAGWMKMGRASVKRVAGWMKMGRASVSKITRGMSQMISYASSITFMTKKYVVSQINL